MAHNSTDPSAQDDNTGLMGDDVTDEDREDSQTSLSNKEEGMFDSP